jgi:hypothetical protein
MVKLALVALFSIVLCGWVIRTVLIAMKDLHQLAQDSKDAPNSRVAGRENVTHRLGG